jgi:NAD(P)-dependent dehydrogenase (short-subunit alcohol dehydrogenase family)
MATALAAAGASVMIADVLKDVGEQTAAAIADTGATARFVQLDVTSDADWEAAAAAGSTSWSTTPASRSPS